MKNFKRICVLLLVFPCILIMTGCGGFFRGESAYDIAVRNGFSGSEEEWINSLQGHDGIDGTPGQDGDALAAIITEQYEIAKQQFLESNPGGEFCDIMTFISQYLQGPTDVQYASNKAVLSAVSINTIVTDGRHEQHPAAGSGVIYQLGYNQGGELNGDAYIITNYHVISHYGYANSYGEAEKLWVAQQIEVSLYGMAHLGLPASVLGGSPQYDIAILSVDGDSHVNGINDTRTVMDVMRSTAVRAADITNQYEPVLGMTVIAVGNPLGEGLSVTDGIISVQSEDIPMEDLEDPDKTANYKVIRTTASINPGNSGGGIFNAAGELAGIVQARTFWNNENEEYPVDNMAYLIPLDIALRVANQIITRYEDSTATAPIMLTKPYYGIGLSGTDRCVWYYEDEAVIHESVIITSLSERSNQYKSDSTDPEKDFKVNDRILTMSYELGGETVTHDIKYSYQVSEFLIDCWADQPVTYTVDRAGVSDPVKITIVHS